MAKLDRDITSILRSESNSAGNLRELSEALNLKPETNQIITQISQKTRADILNDQPSVHDRLGMSALARTLGDIAFSESTQTPLTICVNGKWGTGKTSILKMVEAEARVLGYPCLWLNAWSLETTESLVATVASEIQRESKQINKTDIDFSKLGDLLAQFSSFLLGGSPSAIGSLVSSVGAGIVKASRQEEIREVASLVTARASFESLIKLLTKRSNGRVIIFIDDLDRALPDQIADILKNLKLVLDSPDCIFFLGMDRSVVANSIESYYKKRVQTTSFNINGRVTINSGGNSDLGFLADEPNVEKDFGERYLEKMIQLSVDIPGLTRKAVSQYLELLNIAPEIVEIVNWAPDTEILNPRSLKRYINWLSVSLQIMQTVGLSQPLRNITALKLLALRRDYPQIYNGLLDGQIEELSYSAILLIREKYPEYYQRLLETAKVYLGHLSPSKLKLIAPEIFSMVEESSGIEKNFKPSDEVLEAVAEKIFSDDQYRPAFFRNAMFDNLSLFPYFLISKRVSTKSEVNLFIDAYICDIARKDTKMFADFVSRNAFFG
jgi:hypothetical protein